MRYRKIAHEVDAVQWNVWNWEAVKKMCGVFAATTNDKEIMLLASHVGPRLVKEGQWIIKDPRGYFVLDDEVFTQYYEMANLPQAVE